MRQIIVSFFLLITSFIHATEEVITPELLKLIDHFHLKHDGTLESITEVTQKAWLRPKGKERWESADRFTEADREAVLAYYIQTGKFDERRPTQNTYQAGVICGATTFSMRKRIDFFEKLIHEGVMVKKVVLLSGARSLDPEVDQVIEGCKTEGDAFMVLWKASPLFQLFAYQNLQMPMIATEEGSFRRPTTYDTFVFWLQSKPEGPSLIVTNQPYCCYFEAVAKWALPAGLEVEVVGNGTQPKFHNTSTLLDNLARWIYVHQQINLNSL